MFLIRCFKLEKEYDEYVQENKTSKPSNERSTKPGSVSKDHSGEADETLTELRTTYNNNGSHSRSFSDGGMNQTSSHPVLGRTVSADIYSDDVQLVNYEKYGREGVPYVFDDRKTKSLQKIHNSRAKSSDMIDSEPAMPPPDHRRGRRHSTTSLLQPNVKGFGAKESYKKLEALGEGSYATVYKGISSITGTVVALKEIQRNEEEGTPFTAIREASLLKDLRHANIVILHDIIHTKRMLTLVFEYVSSDLGQYLELQQNGLKPLVVKLFLFQLLRGLNYCHNRKILHRDLKPQNILINEKGELKLADFGLARAKSVPTHTYSNEVVTLWYRPPDVLLGSTDYSTSLDMWGVGCIFAEMISGVPLFPGMKDVQDQLVKIWTVLGTPTSHTWCNVNKYPEWSKREFTHSHRQRLIDCISNLSKDNNLSKDQHCEDLLSKMLVYEPTERISASVSMTHRYFANIPESIHHLPPKESIYENEEIIFPG